MFTGDFAVFLSVGSVDLRGAVDRLSGIVRDILQIDPQAGALFLFVNRTRNRLKALWWDRNGYVLLYKRLDRGTFGLPKPEADRPYIELSASQFVQILSGDAWKEDCRTYH